LLGVKNSKNNESLENLEQNFENYYKNNKNLKNFKQILSGGGGDPPVSATATTDFRLLPAVETKMGPITHMGSCLDQVQTELNSCTTYITHTTHIYSAQGRSKHLY
jgi:hypothetical protein